MKIILLNGSPKKNGNTVCLLKAAADEISQAGIAVEWLHAHELITGVKQPFCTVCSSPCTAGCYQGSALEKAYAEIAAATGLLVGSPVYFGTISGQLKAFFDKSRKMRADKRWFGLPGGALSTGAARFGGQETTIRAIHDIMLVHGMTIVGDGFPDQDCGHFGASVQQPAAADQAGLERARILARRIVQAGRLYAQAKG
ncbi:MAG: NAD(P)H-dependent oxidoreductase [Heliobacteriaceae bacterium]|nr:NAD(P)H-dependent oxidoreductase [Heliobacteriaceae bacterium]MDD4588532.1 NAD(P)H-dependent oxidoreductase [Heliobacteriaceae bacterium]